MDREFAPPYFSRDVIYEILKDREFYKTSSGGVTVEAKVKNGDLVDIMVIRNGENVTDQFVIEF